ncbi:MAG TPA: class I SAM-dependent methyltransferase [Streptosporangiaceae bacterium]|jgi:SAM-dependent methyltransferase
MNPAHAELCSSPEWAAVIQNEVLPLLCRDADLGAVMLEVGPGPGAATGWLAERVTSLVAVEADEQAAAALAGRYAGTNVEVIARDAATLPFADGHFDSAGAFTMLHHIPTAAGQNALLAEILRVLRPGGVLIASDSLPSDGLHHFHEADTCNPVEPGTLLTRLATLGYDHLTIRVGQGLTFIAHKPAEGP